MNKLLKNSSLTLILLTTTLQTIPTPCDLRIFIPWFWSNPQPQENPDQAPAGVTEDDYIAQFHSDMNGQSCIIPLNEMQEMEAAIRQELRNIDLRDKDLTNQIIRSVLCNQVKIGTERDMNVLSQYKSGGFRYTRKEFETIPTSYENNIRVRLESIPHNLNGAAVAQYFGEARKNSLRNDYKKRNNHR
jgi:hypothetical protein